MRRPRWFVPALFVVWFGLQPLVRLPFRLARVPEWPQLVIYTVGLVILIGAVMLWLRRTAAPLRQRLLIVQRDNPQAVVVAVQLDQEWNPIDEPALAILIADRDGLRIGSLLRVEAAEVAGVTTTYVTGRHRAVVIEAAGVVWTFEVISPAFGLRQNGRALDVTVERLRSTLEVLDHVLDRRDELPHV